MNWTKILTQAIKLANRVGISIEEARRRKFVQEHQNKRRARNSTKT